MIYYSTSTFLSLPTCKWGYECPLQIVWWESISYSMSSSSWTQANMKTKGIVMSLSEWSCHIQEVFCVLHEVVTLNTYLLAFLVVCGVWEGTQSRIQSEVSAFSWGLHFTWKYRESSWVDFTELKKSYLNWRMEVTKFNYGQWKLACPLQPHFRTFPILSSWWPQVRILLENTGVYYNPLNWGNYWETIFILEIVAKSS